MAVWTISAQTGTGAAEIGRELARRAGVPLLDRAALVERAHALVPQLGDVKDLEERFGGRLSLLALNAALFVGSPEAVRALELRQRLPEFGRDVLRDAARGPAVIVAPGAFAALRDHPGALHVRLRAPLECRISTYGRQEVCERRVAEKAVRHEDEHQRAWVRTLYHVGVDDPAHFSLVLDVSRFPQDRVVEVLLAAAAAVPEAV